MLLQRSRRPQDYAEGLKWYRKSAEQGLALAQYGLALRYGFGLNVPQDTVESYKWLNLAAAQNVNLALHHNKNKSDAIPEPSTAYISFVNYRLNEVFKSMTMAQRAEGDRLCHEYAARKESGTAKQTVLVSSSRSRTW